MAKIYSFKQCGKSCRLKGNLKKHLKTHVKDGDIDEQSAAAWTANLSSPDISEMLDGSASAANISGEKKLIAPADPNSTPKQKRKSRPPAQKKEKVKSPKKSPFDYDQGQPAQAYIIVPASNTYGANPLR